MSVERYVNANFRVFQLELSQPLSYNPSIAPRYRPSNVMHGIPWEKARRENNFGELRENFRAHDVLTSTEGNITAWEGHWRSTLCFTAPRLKFIHTTRQQHTAQTFGSVPSSSTHAQHSQVQVHEQRRIDVSPNAFSPKQWCCQRVESRALLHLAPLLRVHP